MKRDMTALLKELTTLTETNRFTAHWATPMDKALRAVGGLDDLPAHEWMEIPWFGVLEQWRHDPDVSDILVNGPDREIFIVQRGMRVPTGVRPHHSWIAFAQRQLLLRSHAVLPDQPDAWLSFSGETVHVQEGTADRRLRFALTRPPASPDGRTIAIRLLPQRWRTLDDLVKTEVLPRAAADLLVEAVWRQVTLVIAGSTGSGKTTVIAALLQQMGEERRCVLIEQSRELPQLHDSISMEVNGSGCTFPDLVRLAMRQRPELLIVGEVRGPEAFAMLHGASTGHPGIASIHANDVQGALKNLEQMACADGVEPGIVRGMMTSGAIPLVVCHIGIYGGRRRVGQIKEVTRTGGSGQVGDRYTTNPLFEFKAETGTLQRTRYPIDGDWGNGLF